MKPITKNYAIKKVGLFWDLFSVYGGREWVKHQKNPTYIHSQFLSGHGKFASYLERFKIQEDGNCWCGESQTSEHLLLHCPATAFERGVAEGRMCKELTSLSITPKELHHWLDLMETIYKRLWNIIIPPALWNFYFYS